MTTPEIDRLRHRLQERIDSDPNMNMTKLATKAGLNNTAVRSILTGRSKSPEFATVLAICKALDMSLDELLEGDRSHAEKEMLRLLGQLTVGQQLQLLGLATDFAADRHPAPPPQGFPRIR